MAFHAASCTRPALPCSRITMDGTYILVGKPRSPSPIGLQPKTPLGMLLRTQAHLTASLTLCNRCLCNLAVLCSSQPPSTHNIVTFGTSSFLCSLSTVLLSASDLTAFALLHNCTEEIDQETHCTPGQALSNCGNSIFHCCCISLLSLVVAKYANTGCQTAASSSEHGTAAGAIATTCSCSTKEAYC